MCENKYGKGTFQMQGVIALGREEGREMQSGRGCWGSFCVSDMILEDGEEEERQQHVRI